MVKAKKLLSIFLLFWIIVPCFTQNAEFSKKLIVVSEPTLQNGTEEDAWIPFFVQSQLSSDIQNYSDMKVIDRQNLENIIKEQRIAEYDNDVTPIVALGVNYQVNVTIIKKGTGYSMDCKITDVLTGTMVGKAYNAPSISGSAMENGSAIDEAAAQLLLGMGVVPDKIADLRQITNGDDSVDIAVSRSVETEDNINTAKGLAAERVTGNIVEAMAYYRKATGNKPGVSEAAQRLEILTQNLANGSIGEYTVNEIQLRKEWQKIFSDFETYAENNSPYVVYSVNVRQGNIDYKKETVGLIIDYVFGINPDVEDLYHRIYGAYKYLGTMGHDIKNWNLTLKNSFYYNLTFEIYDSNGNVIGTSKVKKQQTIDSTGIGAISGSQITVTVPANELTIRISVNCVSDKEGGVVYGM